MPSVTRGQPRKHGAAAQMVRAIARGARKIDSARNLLQ